MLNPFVVLLLITNIEQFFKYKRKQLYALIKITILLTEPKRIPEPFISRHCSVLKIRRKSS